MAWFGDSLSGLSHLKGQITNFTKEVLSEGIVKEIDDQTMQLKEANERCIQLQELLDTKDAENRRGKSGDLGGVGGGGGSEGGEGGETTYGKNTMREEENKIVRLLEWNRSGS
ncbi:thyroid receptor-interacting protein 11 isoform X3 [Vespula maculifrons]|uniref:Thyroid receptor-interacting protein 11 isoform X3 n=1 Tax=Vespula maculifrons TaxID=7453 RepID=A0ABD2BFY1_VESMC